MTLKAQVESILRDFPQARDDDQWLTLKLWTVYYPSLMHVDTQETPRSYVYLKDILVLPREDHIKRIRAQIQNVYGRHLPTKIEVVIARRQNEKRWRELMHIDSL